MKQSLVLMVLVCYSIMLAAQTTHTTLPKTTRQIFNSNNKKGTWTNFNTAALAFDDNNYIVYNKFAPTFSSSDYLICSDFGFTDADIPDNATIDKLFLKIIRFKKGSSDIIDLNVYFSKVINTISGPNLSKPDYWPTVETTVQYQENGAAPRNGWNYDAYEYTPADIKKPDFNVRLVAKRLGSNGPTSLYYEQVQVWVQYTVPAAVTTTIQSAINKGIDMEMRLQNRNIFFKGLAPGTYKFYVSDMHGRLLQQGALKFTGDQTILLNNQCKGYCVMTLTGNGKKKSFKFFVDQQ